MISATLFCTLFDIIVFCYAIWCVAGVKTNRKWAVICLFLLEFVYRMLTAWVFQGEYLKHRIIPYIIYLMLRYLWFLIYSDDPEWKYVLLYISISMASSTTVVIVELSYLMEIPALSEAAVVQKLTWDMVLPHLYIFGTTGILVKYIAKWKVLWKLRELKSQKINFLVYVTICFEIYMCLDKNIGNVIVHGKIITAVSLLNIVFVCLGMWMLQTQQEKQFLEQQLQEKYEYFEKVGKKHEQAARIRHDFLNHMQVLKSLRDSKVEKAVNQYERKIKAVYQELLDVESEEIVCMTKEQQTEYEQSEQENQRTRNIICVLSVFVLILSLFIRNDSFYYIGTLFVLSGLLLFSFHYFYLLLKVVKGKRVNKGLKDDLEVQEKGQEQWKELRHELIQQKQMLERLTDEKIRKVCSTLAKEPLTGERALDVMIYEKQRICEECGITFDMQLFFDKQYHLNPVHIVGLLGNLLDNAIESCQRAGGKKYILLETRYHAGFWKIKVENTKSAKEIPIKEGFLTTKKDKNKHGYGMKIVRSIVEKYDGSVLVEDNGETFITLAMVRVLKE